MKKALSILLGIILMSSILAGCKNSTTLETDNTTKNEDIISTTDIQTTVSDDKYLSDGVINETNSRKMIDVIVSKYGLYENNSGVQSSINKHWSYSGYTEKNDNYAKYYDVSADENLEIVIASFSTYDGDIEFLLTCASLFNTSNVDSKEVQQWIRNYKESDGFISKVFGDAEFYLNTEEYYDGLTETKLSVYALD